MVGCRAMQASKALEGHFRLSEGLRVGKTGERRQDIIIAVGDRLWTRMVWPALSLLLDFDVVLLYACVCRITRRRRARRRYTGVVLRVLRGYFFF